MCDMVHVYQRCQMLTLTNKNSHMETGAHDFELNTRILVGKEKNCKSEVRVSGMEEHGGSKRRNQI